MPKYVYNQCNPAEVRVTEVMYVPQAGADRSAWLTGVFTVQEVADVLYQPCGWRGQYDRRDLPGPGALRPRRVRLLHLTAVAARHCSRCVLVRKIKIIDTKDVIAAGATCCHVLSWAKAQDNTGGFFICPFFLLVGS